MKLIKDEIKKKELRIKMEACVGTTQNLINMLKKNLRVLHISCHGFKDKNNDIKRTSMRPRPMGLSIQMVDRELQQNFLLFETNDGQGELVDADQINKLLK